jgi:multidrug efflux system membrane fusion protein
MSRSWLIALFIALAAGGWIAFGSMLTQPEQAADSESEPATQAVAEQAERPLPSVRVLPVSAQTLTSGMVVQGRTTADRYVTIRSETEGPVEEVLVERGESVSAGQELVRLDVEERQARLAEAEALVRQREIEFAAAERLNQQGYRSETDLVRAEAALDSARANLELARQSLDQTVIRAPFDGVINDRMVEDGDFLRVGDSIAHLIDLDPIRVEGQIAERFIGQIEVGTVGMVRLVGGQEVPGVVAYIGRVASDQTRTFPVEVEIPNPEGRIIEGLTAQLQLPTRQVVGYRLPSSVLNLADDGQVGVYTVDGDNMVRFHAAEIVGGDADTIWLAGLPDQMDLIVVGQGYVSDGSEVEVQYVDEIPNRPDATNGDAEGDGDSAADSTNLSQLSAQEG